MNKKVLKYCFLLMTICFILLGIIFGMGADSQKGITIHSSGTIGTIGDHPKEYDNFKLAEYTFYVLGGISGVLCVVFFISDRK